MNLREQLKNLDSNEIIYYDKFDYNSYDKAISEPLEFVRNYFILGGKCDFLFDGIFDIFHVDNVNNYRIKHVVNAYFLGMYFYKNIDYLKANQKSFLGNNKNFLWAWFLCSLYHDAFFNVEDNCLNKFHYNFSYCLNSNRFLYDNTTLEKYYNKGINKNTCHQKDKPHPDHGIYAAEKLYENYISMLSEMLKHEDNLSRFLCGDNINLYYTELVFNKSCYDAMCKIAKIIACHNVFICQSDDEESKIKYKESGLSCLIKSNSKFRYMPNCHKKKLNSYEKLYFLLVLVDTLEPSKKGIDYEEISISFNQIEYCKYEVVIDFFDKVVEENKTKYMDSFMSLCNWLNFVYKDKDHNNVLIIDFSKDKNEPYNA